MTVADDENKVISVKFTAFEAEKVKIRVPSKADGGRDHNWIRGRIELLVGAVAESVPTEATFNALYDMYSGASNTTVLKRTCTVSSHCQIDEMFYKRKDPSVSFAPYAKLLSVWEEGSDNRFKVDFGLYSKLSDAI